MGGDATERRHNRGCHCKRSGCLKNYCECYEAKIPCTESCKCIGCKNVEDLLDPIRMDVDAAEGPAALSSSSSSSAAAAAVVVAEAAAALDSASPATSVKVETGQDGGAADPHGVKGAGAATGASGGGKAMMMGLLAPHRRNELRPHHQGKDHRSATAAASEK